MSIVKWIVHNYDTEPTRKEYEKEAPHFYTYRSGRLGVRRRDAKSSLYYRFFDSEAEAIDFIRAKADTAAKNKRITQINQCGVELLAALESLVLFTSPSKSNAAALSNAYQVIAKAKGER